MTVAPGGQGVRDASSESAGSALVPGPGLSLAEREGSLTVPGTIPHPPKQGVPAPQTQRRGRSRKGVPRGLSASRKLRTTSGVRVPREWTGQSENHKARSGAGSRDPYVLEPSSAVRMRHRSEPFLKTQSQSLGILPSLLPGGSAYRQVDASTLRIKQTLFLTMASRSWATSGRVRNSHCKSWEECKTAICHFPGPHTASYP